MGDSIESFIHFPCDKLRGPATGFNSIAQSRSARYHTRMDYAGPRPSDASFETLPVESLDASSRRMSMVVGWIALLLLAYLVGQFACAMNRTFYQQHAPFFDSCAYDNLLAQVISTTRHDGIIKAAPITMSTNYLPWLQSAIGAKLFPRLFTITRTTGIWMQISWTIPLLLSLYYYFHVLRKLDGPLAFACTIPFISLPVMYGANGGFSDFRMDLALYLFFSLTAVWFLATYETKRWYPWIFMGIAAGLTGLMRATSPVYLVVSLGPPLLLRLLIDKDRFRILLMAAVSGVIAAVVCGWFFIGNYEYLRYYYVDWNIDSKTNMTLEQASEHYKFARDMHLGAPIRWLCLTFGLAILACSDWTALKVRFRRPLRILTEINWVPLYIGVAPVAMLIKQRAGLNPFVSMPACFGVLMFLLALHAKPTFNARPRLLGIALSMLATVFLVRGAIGGVDIHAATPTASLDPTMSSHRQVINLVLSDVAVTGKPQVTVSGTHLLCIHAIGLKNVFTFDYGFRPQGNFLKKGKTFIQLSSLYQPAAAVELREIAPDLPPSPAPSESALLALEETRIDGLAARANNSVDYVVIPDETTLAFAETSVRRNYSNVIARRLHDRTLARGKWEQIGPPIVVSPKETVLVFANRALSPAATQPAR